MIDPSDLRDVFDRAASLPPVDRAAFLEHACGDNVVLRQEVERLLAADARLGPVFDRSVGSSEEGGSAGAAERSRTLSPGTHLGPYVVDAMVGAGGMGEVYRAHDTRLGRAVAIKVLPAALTEDSTARHRFEREARAVAALSHPHICPLFDIGREGDRDYLVMEFLNGETLAASLRRGRLRLADALRLADQIASALAAAHRAGIVHRDLKPGNIMLTEAGVRLLDFGLARHTRSAGQDTATVSLPEPLTGTGLIVGTLPDMAPEQIEGRPADARTDIFAFGVVLYEMVTGRRAFEAPSHAALIGSILRDDPPSVTSVDPTLPPALDRVIRRCLAKDPTSRWQSVDGIATALLDPEPPRRRWLLKAAASVTSAALVAAIAAALWPSAPAVPKVTAIRRITHDRSIKEYPFTDGTRVYYASWSTGFASTALFQVPITGGESVPLPTTVRDPLIRDMSPDGTELLISNRQGGQLYVMPVLSGQPRPVGEIHAGDCARSPDDKRLVYTSGNDVVMASENGSSVRRLVTAPGGVAFPRWAPDGQRVRYTVVTPGQRTIWEVAADGSSGRKVIPDWTVACCGSWTPDGRYYVFEAERDGEYALWALPEATQWTWTGRHARPPVKLTTGPMRYENAIPAHDGRTILALGTPPTTGELVRFDQRMKQFLPTLGGLSARDVEFSRDVQWIAYVNPADDTLWRSRADGSKRQQLTFPPGRAKLPRWSPDGKSVVYTSRAAGIPEHVFVVSVGGGGQPRQVGDSVAADASWSADGGRLVYATDSPQLEIMDLRSHQASIVPGSEGLFSPRWSQDGASIAALSVSSTALMLYRFATGRWETVAAGGFGWPIWTHDGAHIQALQGSTIVRIRVSDRHIVPLASIEGIQQVMLEGGEMWIGRGPDDAPLLLRDTTPLREVYALEVDWP